MLAVTIRMKYLKIATLLVFFAVLISIVILAVVSAGKREDGNLISTNAQRVAYLKECGWEVAEEPIEACDVIIPSEFNAFYTEYNALQAKQGYDLAEYKGVSAKKYTYKVNNYPNAVENVEANMLIYNDEVIGGDVSSTELNGFMQGLKAEKVKINGG